MFYPKSKYSYTIIRNSAHQIISIIDEFSDRNPTMTVTNNIDNVVIEIGKQEKINPEEYMVIYRDTEGYWCGYDVKKHNFIPVGVSGSSENDAINEYIKFKS